MARPLIRAVFFDAAGTLFRVHGEVGEVYAGLARQYGIDTRGGALEAGFRRSYGRAPPLAFPGATSQDLPALERRWWYAVVREAFSQVGRFSEFDDYFDRLYEYFARAEAWRLYPETVEVLTVLRNSGYRLGVISNFDSRLLGLLEGLGIQSFFDTITYSTQAGSAKPQRAIFFRALAAHRLWPHEALHLGDSDDMDVAGARRVGIHPVHVDRLRTAVTGHRSVTRLDEVLDILGVR